MPHEWKKLEGLQKHYQLDYKNHYDFCIAFDKPEAVINLSENSPEEIKSKVGRYITRFDMNNPSTWK